MAVLQKILDVLPLNEEKRRFQRVRVNLLGRYMLADGTAVICRIIDMSLSGAAVACEQRPEVGSLITLGKTPSRIVRHIEGGIAVEFTRMQHPDFLEENVTGP